MKIREILTLGTIALIILGIISLYMSERCTMPLERDFQPTFQDTSEVSIYGNDDWELLSLPGNGSAISPFIIDRKIFSSLQIGNSDVYFIIQNCECEGNADLRDVENGLIKDSRFNTRLDAEQCSSIVFSNITNSDLILYECNNIVLVNFTNYDTETNSDGIIIRSSQRVIIDECYFEGYPWGVSICDSSNCSVQCCYFTDCGYWPPGGAPCQGGGLLVDYCLDCKILNDSFIDNYGQGFRIVHSESIDIINNYSEYNGLSVQNCIRCSINNNCLKSGLDLSRSENCDIIGNELGLQGLFVEGSLEQFIHNVINNTLEGKPLLYVLQESDSNHANGEYGQIFVIDSTRVGIINSQALISQLGIYVYFSEYCLISQVITTKIWIRNSPRTTIQNSELGGGISLLDSPEVVINENIVKDSQSGILLDLNSSRSIISNNLVSNVLYNGITIASSECKIENNTITGCGRQLSACYTTTTMVQDFGAIRVPSDDCRIINNIVVDNFGYGIWITGKRNIIYMNVIARNSLGNGLSSGADNQWDNGIDTGNSWGDWSLVGVYFVPGSEGCIDRYPNGYRGNTTVIGISFTTLLVTSLSIGGICLVLIWFIKIYRPRARTNI